MFRRQYWLAITVLALLAPPATAGIGVKLDGLDDGMQDAALAALQINQYAKRHVSAAQAQRLYAMAAGEIQKALRPYGYYDAQVTGELKPAGEDWQVILHVKPGEPVKIAAVDIELDGPAAELRPVRHALSQIRRSKGDVLNDATYEASKSALQSALTASGFLDARMTEHRVEVTRADHRAVIKLAFKPGQRYRFGTVHFKGSQFAPGFLKRYVPFNEGDYFAQNDLLLLQSSLNGADYFSVVNVLPATRQAADGVVDVNVVLVPAKRSIYTGGPFIGTDTGVGIRAGLERRWVNRHGHKWKSELVLAQRLKTLSTLYTIPLPGPNQRSYNFGAEYRDADTTTSHSRTLDLVGNETRQWHGWTRTLGVHGLIGTFTVGKRSNDNNDTPGVEHGSSRLIFPELSLARKHGDNPIFVRHGWSLNLAARSTVGTPISDASFSQVTADAKWIYAFLRRDRLIVRGSAGFTWTNDFSKLPPQLRFFAGGDRSVRGYGFQSIGPRNDYDRVIGGKDLLVAGATFEHYFSKQWGMAAFVDAGNAFDGSDYRPAVGTGLGLRWISPVGMIRVDVGVPVHNARHHGLQLHLVIGPDL